MLALLIVIDLSYCIAFCGIAKTSDGECVSNNEYNSACTKWRLGAWIPFIIYTIVLICSVAALINAYPSYNAPIGFFVKSFISWWLDLLFTAIRSISASSYLTTKLSIKPDEEPNAQTRKNFAKEANNKKYGTAAMIGGAYSLGKHAKKTIKELTD